MADKRDVAQTMANVLGSAGVIMIFIGVIGGAVVAAGKLYDVVGWGGVAGVSVLFGVFLFLVGWLIEDTYGL
jgi:hypothetical protein